MARAVRILNALQVARATAKGMLADGGGLYLQVGTGGAKSWIFRFKFRGRAREMGLGPLHTVSLAEARAGAIEARKLLLANIDPIEARKAERDRAHLDAAKAMTFKQCAEAYITAHAAGWRNVKHAGQWRATLATYAYPSFGDLPVPSVDTARVVKALEPIWNAKSETASRLRGRIEAVLDWAATRGYRSGTEPNPARWKGHLQNLLPKPAKVRRVEHHAALPFDEIGAFVALLREQEGIAALALEFTILTAGRTGEAIGATWDEFDLEAGVWAIAGTRMKGGREHRVPFSAPALAIIKRMKEVREGEFVFPGGKRGKPLSNMAFLMLLRRMGRDDLTAHGFRSTFRDWAAERTNFPREVCEQALAHTIGNRV
ncbi:MAG TPA: integrase arm-type DNA-binding domain-containing protein, partial [Stellaceae bacterium]|nr:integrase arm-type DNA-binding domain-containing protein [Stellaceae bacterium]